MFVCLFKLQRNRIIANQLFIRSQIGCKDIAMVCIFYSHLHLFLPKLEISDRIQLKIAFVFMIIQVKAIDTTCGVTATGGLHSNFFMGIANIDSLPTATMILSISYRSHVQYQGARFLLCKVTINVNLQVPPEGYF